MMRPSAQLAGVAILAALSAGCATRSVGPWEAPAMAVAPGEGEPRLRLWLDRFEGYEVDSDVEKARRAAMLIRAALSSAEFQCRVLSFDHRRGPDGAADRSPCRADPVRSQQDGSATGFYWGSTEDYGEPMTNGDVYKKIVAADEAGHPGEAAGIMHLSTGVRPSALHTGSIGATKAGVTRTNSGIFRGWVLSHLAGHWAHEYMHVLGFKHEPGRSEGRPFSVPYAVGLMVCEISAGMLPEGYSRDGETCVETMRGL